MDLQTILILLGSVYFAIGFIVFVVLFFFDDYTFGEAFWAAVFWPPIAIIRVLGEIDF